MTNLGHIDRVLGNMSVAYMQADSAFIADKVFPIVPVQKQSDIYYIYDKGDMFRDEVKERGRGAESVGGDWNASTADPYYCRKYAFHYDITEEERVNYDAPLVVERDSQSLFSQVIKIDHNDLCGLNSQRFECLIPLASANDPHIAPVHDQQFGISE